MKLRLLFIVFCLILFLTAIPTISSSGAPDNIDVFPQTLTGYLITIWSDRESKSNALSRPIYILVKDDGESVRLTFSDTIIQNLQAIDLSSSNLVTVEGEWVQLVASDATLRIFKARTIHSVIGPSVVQSPPPVVGAQPWITILCKQLYDEDVPHPLAFYQELFTGSEYLDHYWRELSLGTINLSGSNVVGWYTLPQHQSYYYYDMDGDGYKELDVSRAANDCTAVADSSVYFPNYVGINLIFNASWWYYGGSYYMTRDGMSKVWRMTWLSGLPSQYFWESTVAHEMGHGFGLPHSGSIYGVEYENPWDVMGYDGSGCPLPDFPVYGCPGQHTIAYHKDLLGWIPISRKYVATWGSVSTFTLERLESPASSNYLMAKIPIGGSDTHFYTLETRQKIGYDKYMPGNAVVIHEVDTNHTQFPAEVVDSDNNGDTGDAGTMWTPGEIFTDTVNGVKVCINSTTTTGFKVTIGLGVTVNCTFTPDLSTTNLWASPASPTTGQEVVFTTRLYSGGPAAQNVVVSSTIPNDMTYFPGSASSTQGTVSGSNPLLFNVGAVDYDSTVTLTFTATVNGGVVAPTALVGPVQITWQGGSLLRSHVVIANGLPVYLPLVSR
jgi:uncharacterized repeat protein (TIGR01451 family)